MFYNKLLYNVDVGGTAVTVIDHYAAVLEFDLHSEHLTFFRRRSPRLVLHKVYSPSRDRLFRDENSLQIPPRMQTRTGSMPFYV